MELDHNISVCFKTVGDTEEGTSDIRSWTESIQNFVSLIPADSTADTDKWKNSG